MTPRHQVSRAAITLIKRFEGFRAKAAELEDGRWTIGYGHTRTARGGTQIAEGDAEALLLYDLINVAHAVNEWTYAPLNQNQFDALVSFAFNIGLENFRRSTTLRRINEGRMLEAALAMELWRRADFEGERIVVDALVRRRSYEKSLFLKPMDAWAPAPSPVLPPKIDYDVAPFTLTDTPTVLKTDLGGARAIAERASPPRFVPLEDTGPSATEAAAAAVTARLEALTADPGPVSLIAAPVKAAQDAAAAARPAPAPAPAKESSPEAPPKPEPAQPKAAEAPLPKAGEEVPRDIDVVSTDPKGASEVQPSPAPTGDFVFRAKTPAKRQPVSILVWVALAFLGLALFTAAVKFGFRAAPPGSLGGLDPLVWGLAVGILGIGCTAAAVYMLLMRLAGPEATKKTQTPKKA